MLLLNRATVGRTVLAMGGNEVAAIPAASAASRSGSAVAIGAGGRHR